MSSVSFSLPDFSGVRLAVVGDVMLDRYWFGDVQRISPEAPVPIVRVKRIEERLGGAANVALNASALGAHAMLLGVVGADEAASRLQTLLTSGPLAGRIEPHLTVDEGSPTIIKLRVIGRQQQLLRIDFEETPAADALAQKLVDLAQTIGQCDVLVLSDYGKGALGQIEEILRLAREHGKAVIVDPKGDDYTRYRGVTVLTPNRAELREVVGAWRDDADLERRAQALREQLELQYLLLTRSEEGMSLFSARGAFHVPAQAREVFDVSGAGDTVVATLACWLAAGQSIEQAVKWANRAGGIVVGKLGTATVTREELMEIGP
jgi:D-glycero-beta-D-manno-heptose-7-phosphate kinase